MKLRGMPTPFRIFSSRPELNVDSSVYRCEAPTWWTQLEPYLFPALVGGTAAAIDMGGEGSDQLKLIDAMQHFILLDVLLDLSTTQSLSSIPPEADISIYAILDPQV